MYFKEIELNNFRNYENLKIDFHKKVNIIVGNNAQGKTNLIEGLYIMSLGKSFRTSKDSEMIKFGCEMAHVKTVYCRDDRDVTIEIGFLKNKKSIKIDGVKKKKASDLLENIYIVVFSPDDLKIVKEEPEKRRRFIDRELCQMKPVYFDSFSRYKRVLAQRNFMLKEESPDMSMLDIWDEELCEHGSRIILERKKFIEKLREISRDIHHDLTEKREALDIKYESDIPLKDNLREQKEAFREILYSYRKKDLKRRNTGHGPHRDDLCITVDGVDVRSYGSQGQQRSAALSLKLAEIKLIYEETGENPVLLLDDVLSELDRMRQKQLINSFGDIQIFITTTEITEDLKKQLNDHSIFEVKNGIVKRAE
jgi:DNA replication and repair protein RecF